MDAMTHGLGMFCLCHRVFAYGQYPVILSARRRPLDPMIAPMT